MASKSGKSSKKDTGEISLTLDSITDLLNHHTARLSAEFKSSFQIVESKLNLIQSTLEHQEERIKSLETAAEDVAQRVTDLEERCSTLQVSNEHLRTKVCDLEGRSRRQNIRVVGLEESVEGTRPSEFFPSFLCEVFGQQVLPTPPEIDRAHRSLAPKPKKGERPRPVIMRLHKYQVKELIIREARKRGTLEYRGQQIRIYEDYPADVVNQRAEYRQVMSDLYNRGLKPSLLYPSRLRIVLPNGEKQWLKSVEEARQCVARQPPA